MSSAAALLVDRFVSASSADDLRDSLQAICTALQSTEKEYLDPSLIWNEEGALNAFLEVLTSSEYKKMPVDQGPPLICQIYSEFLKSRESKIILQEPETGRLIHALLDVVSNVEESSYARVSSLQVLQKIFSKYPSIAQSQLLEVPNGLHRLADSFAEENEQVRNEVVLLAKIIAEWPSCAKVWVFAEVCNSVIDLAVKEGGLTKGNVLVVDCLVLLHSLLKHDVSLSDLVWQAPNFADKLCSLIDLRLGSEFLDPKLPSQPDDLDDILQSGGESEKMVTPRLTKNEEMVLERVLVLMDVMLGIESIRITVWKQHPKLGSMLWELALFSPPPPDMPYDCALPPASLQQKALESVSLFFLSPEMMERHNGLDRLLHLVCSGGVANLLEEKRGLSLSALHVIREMLTDEMSSKFVMHTLAPPISTDGPEGEPTVVTKLLNTCLENIENKGDQERRDIMLLGALGALGVFLRDSTSREMMVKIISPHTLIDLILKSLESENDVVALAFLRFLSELIIESPAAVETVLSCPESMSLSILFGSSGRKATLAGLLLGIAMDSMSDKNIEKCGGWTKTSILTMISKRKGGITGFIGELEGLKNIELPWGACKLEEEIFAKWYNVQVLLVRRRIVEGLSEDATKGGEEEEQCSGGISLHDLQALVNQQVKELEEVRNELSVAKETIQSSELKVEVWKRRVESTPTQLDDMLTEYIAKVEEITSDNVSLKTELECNQDMYQKDLSEKEIQVTGIKEKYELALQAQEEAESESEQLRAELAALSTAYSSLENEYNRSQLSSSASTPGEALSADSHSEGQQQPQGEVSCQGQGVTEMEDVRAENTRLRNDARAADDWMQLAHRRMVEIESENTQLRQEIFTLKSNSKEETAKTSLDSIAPEVHTSTCMQQSEGMGSVEAIEKNLENKIRLEFQERLAKSEVEVTNILRAKEELMKEKDELRGEITSLQTKLESVKSDERALDENRLHLEPQITSKSDGESSGEGELVEKLRIDLKTKQTELDSLRASGKALQDQSTTSTIELEKYLKVEEELDLRDQKIKELEARIVEESTFNSGTGQNKEAQSTIHSKLEAKCNLYENEIEQLSREILVTRDDNLMKSNKLEEMTAKLHEFQQWSVAAQEKLANLMAEKEKVERELDQVTDSSAASGATPKVAEQLQELRTRFESERSEKQALEIKCSSYQHEIEQLSKDMLFMSEDNTNKSKELQEMTTKLDEFQQWSVTAQEKLEKVTVEKEMIAAAFEEAKGQIADSGKAREKINDVQDLHSKLELEKSLKYDVETKCAAHESDIEQLSKEMKVLRDKEASKSNELELLTKKLEEFQNWSVNAQEQMSSLLAEKEAIEAELRQVKQKPVAADDTQQSVEDLHTRNEELESEKKILEERNTVIEMELNSSRDKISTLELAVMDKESNLSILHDDLQENRVASEELEELKTKVERLQESILKQETEAADVVEQWTTRYSQLEEQNAQLGAKLQGIDETNSNEVSELELMVKTLERSLETQQEDFSDAVEKWSSRCEELEEATKVKELEVANLTEQISDLQHSSLDANSRAEQEKEANASLTEHLNVLEHELSVTKGKLKETLIEAEDADDLKVKIQSKEVTILEQTRTLETFDNRVRDLEEEIEVTRKDRNGIRDLQDRMINEWEGRLAALEEEKSRLLEETRTLSTELEAREDEFATQLNDEQHARFLAEQTSRGALTEVEMLAKQSEEAIQQWQDRVEELESIVAELEQQLEEQQSEATDAIAQWEATCSELEAKARETESSTLKTCEILRDILMSEKRKQVSWIGKLDPSYECTVDLSVLGQVSFEDFPSVISSQAEEYDNAMVKAIETQKTSASEAHKKEHHKQSSQLEILRSDFLTLEQNLKQAVHDKRSTEDANSSLKVQIAEITSSFQQTESELEISTSKLTKLEGEINAEREIIYDLEKELGTGRKEANERITVVNDLRKEIDQLTDELEKANQSLQVQLTDEISKKATEMTTEALRCEIEQLRSKIDNKHEMLLEERRARKTAEQNAISLTNDLAVVLKVNKDDPNIDDRIKGLVVEAGDSLHGQERQKIQELRSSLERSLRELVLSKTNEKEASDKALAAEAQAALSEQEIITAKADVAFLSQSLEDLREADAARVATFEYRIRALEDDRDLMRRVNADELETLRNEVSRTVMEKDRIFHALKESEKANAALVHATSKEPEQEPDHTCKVDDELSMLRTSNAYLLGAATEEAANSERRIREAVTANASLAEADIIVERELRVAAETGLEHVKAQLDELRRSQEGMEGQTVKQNLSPGRQQSQVSQLRNKARQLEMKNAELQNKIENDKSSTDKRIAELTEQCRRAQAVAMKIKGKERFDSEVKVEVRKIEAMHHKVAGKDENWVIVNDENVETDSKVGTMSASEAYDYIAKQKTAIDEERKIYKELLVEHDDLLALLAQQDLEKESLNAALADAKGEEAVEAAILEAEEKAIQQFGKYI
eukprot:CAMPEP_0194247660 /NCGR_PEP_ID=MMETSP0158-20130606/16923_1 /TAXON_ID=33649 /ORGANISM="Thalassionema nitzschioides, Strain L26-B" /LENGTH=2479 /DNA_ID=CAMNT_0038983787 /DNA_START=105 /DNA_END=7541 /DNA_ORIENTATION=-